MPDLTPAQREALEMRDEIARLRAALDAYRHWPLSPMEHDIRAASGRARHEKEEAS